MPEPYNTDLLVQGSNGESKLKPGLLEGQNYEIVSPEMMDVFKNYKGEKI